MWYIFPYCFSVHPCTGKTVLLNTGSPPGPRVSEWWAPNFPASFLKTNLLRYDWDVKSCTYLSFITQSQGLSIHLWNHLRHQGHRCTHSLPKFLPVPSNIVIFVCMVKTFKARSTPLSKFEVYNAVLLAIGTMFYSRSQNLLILCNWKYPLIITAHLLVLPAPWQSPFYVLLLWTYFRFHI